MITVDLQSQQPIEDQIRRQIHTALARGAIKCGDALPSVRQLAGDLGVHWNTVARAYRRLRDDGLLTVGRGRTVTVRREALPALPTEPGSEREVAHALDEVFTQAKLRGLSLDELRSAIDERLSSWRSAWEGTR